MMPVLDPEALTTLSTLKNAINSAVPSPSGSKPEVVPEAEAAITLAV